MVPRALIDLMERVDHAHLASLDDIRGDLRSNNKNSKSS